MKRRTFCLSSITVAVASAQARARGDALEIGILPNVSARALMNQYQPMREYLARELARPVQVSTAPDWSVFHRRVLDLDYDVAITAAHMARLAQIDGGFAPQLSYVPGIKALLVVASERPVPEAAALKGQVVALSNRQSLVTLRSLQWLADEGLVLDRDFHTIRAPADDSVGNMVLRGDAVAGICSGGEYRVIPEAVRARLRVQRTIAEVASFVVMTGPRLPPAEVRAVRQALLGFAPGSAEGRQFLAATGFDGIGPLADGVMEAMDAYVPATRRLL